MIQFVLRKTFNIVIPFKANLPAFNFCLEGKRPSQA